MTPLQDFTYIRALGTGASGSVYEIQSAFSFQRYALKRISHRQNRAIRQLAHQEADIHAALRHQHILKFERSCEGENEFNIITELCSEGTLYSFLFEGNVDHSQELRTRVCAQLCAAVHYLHEGAFESSFVLHRDLKLENILMASDRQIRVADFGAAIVKPKGRLGFWGTAGTPGYMSPEMVRRKSYGTATDIWSLGLVLAEIWSGCLWKTETQLYCTSMDAVCSRLAVMPDEPKNVVEHFLREEANDRRSAGWALSVPFLFQSLTSTSIPAFAECVPQKPPAYNSGPHEKHLESKTEYKTAHQACDSTYSHLPPFRFLQ